MTHLTQIKEIIADVMGIYDESVDEYFTLFEDLGILHDELDAVVFLVEKEFGVHFSDEEVDNLDTVLDISNLVDKQQYGSN